MMEIGGSRTRGGVGGGTGLLAPSGVRAGEVRQPRFSLRTFQSLKIRDFRYYWVSSLGQMAAMNMQMMASGWFMYKLTGSTAMLGLTMLASALPSLVLAPVGGMIADRLSKKLVLITGLFLSALIALWIAVPASLHIITWHYLLVSAVLQGTLMALIMPSRQSIINDLVGRENLMNAVALNSTGMNLNQLGAPALAGFIVATMGIEGVYYIMAALYVLAAFVAFPMRRSIQNGNGFPARRSPLGDLKDGLQYVRGNGVLLTILFLTLLTALLAMPYRMLLPAFTEGVLKVGPERLGLLMSASGVGALAGSLVIASMGSKGRGMLFLHTGTVTALCIIAFSFSHSYLVSLAIMAVGGIGQSGRMALGNVLIQSYTEDAYLGRVMSLFMMQMGLASLGTFGVSLVAEVIGIQAAFFITGVLLLLATLYYYVFSRRIRQLA